MEEVICQYNKFGFCKYRSECRKKHITIECEDLECFKTSKSCNKRHPKRSKKYDSANRRFESDCAYKHVKPKSNKDHEHLKEKVDALEKIVQANINTNQDNQQLKDKIEVLEKVVHAMTRKVLCLETELKEVKKKSTKDPKLKSSEHVKEKQSETKEEVSCENISFNDNDLKGTTSTPKGINDKAEKLDFKNYMLSCNECNYVCKKEKSLKNHMLTKHEQHQCKECEEKLPNFMQLLKHVAKHHTKNQGENEEILSKEEALVDKVINEQDQLDELEAELRSLKKELS